jgi:uncharacterized protein (DUF362 family)
MDAIQKKPLHICRVDGSRGDRGERHNWHKSVFSLLDESLGMAGSCLAAGLKGAKTVLVKPNLVEAIAPPVTTPVGLVAALVDYLTQRASGALVIVAEGCGAADYETGRAFAELGYSALAREKSIELVDLNKEPLVKLTNPGLTRWPEMYLPGIVMESFIISVPVLKAHTLSTVTLTMKNMMGAAPPRYYQAGGHCKKSAFHVRMQDSILDLNRYRTPDFTLLDATVGMAEGHLSGPPCDPPPGLLVAGTDPVAVDAYGAALLKKDWRAIGHISGAHGELGYAEPLRVVET